MWWIFPQHEQLGYSPIAKLYGITCLDEAKAFLADEYLGACLRQIAEALLALETTDAEYVFGEVDAMKLRSSRPFSRRHPPDEPLFGAVLDKFFDGVRDQRTLELLA